MPGVLGIAGARYLGLATGLMLLAGVALTQWSVAPSRAALGLDLKLTVVPHGELEVGPAGPALLGRGLRPGHEAVGAVTVRNQTGETLAVRPKLTDGPVALDATVQYELIDAVSRGVYSGPASGLRKGGATFLLRSGERTTIAVRAWVADGDRAATRGRAGEWRLAFTTDVVPR
jgi:hypothetical protein